MKSIVVPLDGSENAERALPRAAELAGALGHRLMLFCVAESGSGSAFTEFATAENVSPADAAERYLDQVSAPLTEELDVETRVASGNSAPKEIMQLSEEPDVDLIVMCRHGASAPSQWLLGSVTDKIVRASNCPILVIPT